MTRMTREERVEAMRKIAADYPPGTHPRYMLPKDAATFIALSQIPIPVGDNLSPTESE